MTNPPLPVHDYLHEDDISKECRDLLSSLPIERGWVVNHIYQFEGFWIPSKPLQGLLACQKHFQALDTDTILASCPKSGTTWLKAMSFALLNRSRSLDLDQHPLLTTNPHDLVPFLENTLYQGRELPDLSTFTSPRLFGTHVPYKSLPISVKDSSCKIVYICRDPKDVFVSLWHFTNKLRPQERKAAALEVRFEQFCNGAYVYGPFWDHVLGYWNESMKNPQKVLFLKYEEVKKQPGMQLKRLVEFLECPFSSEEESKGKVDEILELCSLESLSKLEVNKNGRLVTGEVCEAYFRKGEVGGWAEVLTPEMAEKLDRIVEEKTFDSGFKF